MSITTITYDDEQPDMRGPAVVIQGSLLGGVKAIYGPFDSVNAAVEWVKPLSLALGHACVSLLTPAEQCPVKSPANEEDQ